MIKIDVSQTGNKKVFVQKHFNTSSGHEHIITMLEVMGKNGHTLPDVTELAFNVLYEQWEKGDIGDMPLFTSPRYVTEELAEMTLDLRGMFEQGFEMMKVLKQVAEDLQNIELDGDVVGQVRKIQQRSIDLGLVEGADSYASNIVFNNEDDSEDDEDW